MQSPYTLYHPKWYRHRMSVWWWLEKWTYARFVLRELTSLAVAYFAVITLWQISSIASGPQAYTLFMDKMAGMPFLLLNLLAFIAVLFHAVTWLNLAPKAMVVRLKGKRIPDAVIVGANYGLWAILTIIVAWFLLRG